MHSWRLESSAECRLKNWTQKRCSVLKELQLMVRFATSGNFNETVMHLFQDCQIAQIGWYWLENTGIFALGFIQQVRLWSRLGYSELRFRSLLVSLNLNCMPVLAAASSYFSRRCFFLSRLHLFSRLRFSKFCLDCICFSHTYIFLLIM